MEKVLYFAFGSNMDQERLERRVGKVDLAGMAVMPNTGLIFSTVDTAKRDNGYAAYRHKEGTFLWGVLYLLTPHQLTALDGYEGVGTAYVRTMVPVEQGCEVLAAVTYRRIDDAVVALPKEKYLNYLKKGAKQLDIEQIMFESIQAALEDSRRFIDAPVYDPESFERALAWPKKSPK